MLIAFKTLFNKTFTTKNNEIFVINKGGKQKMIKGGYKIIDFKDTPLTTGGSAMMITDIHQAIEGSYRKPLLLAGLTIDGVEKNDTFAFPEVNEGAFVFNVYGKTITVQDTDAVTITDQDTDANA